MVEFENKIIESKDFYTFAELLLSLKDYFFEGQNILKDMQKLIDVSSKFPYRERIWIEQKTATNIGFKEFIEYKEESYEGKLHIDITKKYSPIQAIRELQGVYRDDTLSYYFDNAKFVLDYTGDTFVFKNISECNSKIAFKPELRIKDVTEFNRLYQRLVNEGYLTYPHIYYFYDQDIITTTLTISINKIDLEQYNPLECIDKDKSLIVCYSVADDSLFVKDTRENPVLTIEQLINLPVDKRNIYKGYIPIIERNLNKTDNPLKLIEEQTTNGKIKSKVYTKTLTKNNSSK